MATASKQPTYYIPHGAGPCFYMDWSMGPADTWNKLADWLKSIGTDLTEAPRALLVVSAHWEEETPTVTTAAAPPLYYDYYGFPKHTYELSWAAPGSPDLAARVRDLLKTAGIASAENAERGLDHGVFVPLKLTFPDASIPVVQLSLKRGLDPAEHLKIGRALAPLRDEGVLIVGSGMSYHNMRGFNQAAAHAHSQKFDAWMTEVVASDPENRDASLSAWKKAPSAIEAHPREEHLIPLMVAAGAAMGDRGLAVFRDEVMKVVVSGVRFG